MGYILQSFWRHWHRWVSLLIAIPLLLTVATGVLLMTRGFNTWMQPVYPESSSPELKVTFEQILAAAQSVPEAKIHSWNDISQIDIRPGKGQIRVRGKFDHWEVSVDSATGAMLQAGKRRVSFFTALHEGAYFGSFVRYGIFFPSAFGTLFLIVSGLFMFFQPFLRKYRQNRR
jgi:uncharacterized iron-regulated membrane protein